METQKQNFRGKDTINIIKDALYVLIEQKCFREITVVEIAKIAHINRKTFYNHFSAIEDALLDIEKDFLNEISGKFEQLDTKDLAGAIYIYYDFLNDDDPVRQKLLFGEDYERFFEKLNDDVMALLYERFCDDRGDRDLIMGYLYAVPGIPQVAGR